MYGLYKPEELKMNTITHFYYGKESLDEKIICLSIEFNHCSPFIYR